MSYRVRLMIWYTLAVGSIGALQPFLMVTFAREGLDPTTSSAMMALFPGAFLIAAPLWGWLADRTGRSTPWMRIAAVGAAAGSIALTFAHGAMAIALSATVLAMCRAPLGPLVDVATVHAPGSRPEDYGRIRLWGSVGFAAGVGLVGLGIDAVPRLPMIAGTVLICAAAVFTFALPDPGGAGVLTLGQRPWRLLRVPGMAALLGASVLHGVGLATYDFFFSLHMERLAGPPGLTGIAFAIGVAVEVGVMAAAPVLLRRFGAARMVQVAVALAIPRWLVTGLIDDPFVLAATQALHGVSFGAFWIGAVSLVAERAPGNLRNSGQGLLMAANAGLGPLLATLLAGTTVASVGTHGLFLIDAALAVVATALAVFGLSSSRRSTGEDEGQP